MGDPLNATALAAFEDELEKIARFSGLKTLGSRILSPREGFREGWKAMTPSLLKNMPTSEGKDLAQAIAKTQAAQGKKGFGAAMRRTFGAGTHLATSGVKDVGRLARQGKIKGVAEELSRRGWTGQGRLTKYVPLGEKGQLGVWAGSAAPGMYRAATGQRQPGEAGLGEQIGEQAGWLVPGILAAGTGMMGSMALPLIGSSLASRAGKAIDRRVGG